MSQDITIKFVDFWSAFDIYDNKFVKALSAKHNVTVLPKESRENPDLLFFSRSGNAEHLKYGNCIKIYFTGENNVPDFNECDYALSFHHINFGARHLRYPLYMLYEYDMAQSPCIPADHDATERPFCTLLMRNYSNCDPRRLEIIDAVDSYRKLTYGGPFRNNTGGCVAEKIPFIKNFKFNLALENSCVEGYITEKLLEPLATATIPIYWGAPDVSADFNPEAFININDYNNLGNFISDLQRIDNDNTAYLRLLHAPNFRKDCQIDFDARLENFLDTIVTTRRTYRCPYGESGDYHQKELLIHPFTTNRYFMKLAKAIQKI